MAQKKELQTRVGVIVQWIGLFLLSSCTTLPEPEHHKHSFPTEGVFVKEPPNRPYKTLGLVRAKVNFSTMNPEDDDNFWCKNYYNKAVQELVKKAKKEDADAVVEVRSVVFLLDGRRELYLTPECSDDGHEGQILVQGVAVKWEGPEPEPKSKSKSKSKTKPKVEEKPQEEGT